MILYRTVLTIVGVASAILFSPWITAVCIVLLAVPYRALEAIALGAILDMLWLPHDTLLYSFPLCTIVAIVIVWGFEPLRLEFLR
jgi:hypothetical protein